MDAAASADRHLKLIPRLKKLLLLEDLCARMLKKKVKEIKQQPLPLVRIALEKKNAATASAIYIYECELHC